MFDSFTEFVSEMAEELSAFKEIISAAGLIVIDICALVIICFCAKEKKRQCRSSGAEQLDIWFLWITAENLTSLLIHRKYLWGVIFQRICVFRICPYPDIMLF